MNYDRSQKSKSGVDHGYSNSNAERSRTRKKQDHTRDRTSEKNDASLAKTETEIIVLKSSKNNLCR